MDTKQIGKQMVRFHKAAFDNSFNVMSMVYEQNQKMAETVLSQAAWMPEEGKQAAQDWMFAYRAGCNDMKKMVDENFGRVEAYFDQE